MYFTQNEGQWVISERFIKTLKSKTYTKINLNKWVDQYNNTSLYHHSINKKPINADYSFSTENIESKPKTPKFKVNDRVRITKYKNILSKHCSENWSGKIFIIDSVLKTNPWTYGIKDLNIEIFYKKKFLRKRIVAEYLINKLLSRTRQ